MDRDPENFDKEFLEIVESNDLKDISENFKKEISFSIKDVLLLQQSLLESMTHVSDIIFYNMYEEQALEREGNEVYQNMMLALYRISFDFNECMIEYLDIDFDENEDED